MTGVTVGAPVGLAVAGLLSMLLPLPFLKWVARVTLLFMAVLLYTEWAGQWHAPDALAAWFFRIVVMIAGVAIWYSEPYIALEAERHQWPLSRQRRYFGWLFVFVAALVALSLWNNFLFLWLVIEVVTLSSVVLVGIGADPRSTEAAWKYLLITEAGGLAALLGTVVALTASGHSLAVWSFHPALEYPQRVAPHWALVGAYMALVGYATKAGLAPFHAWLPDAHSEAPAPVSALLSGLKLAGAVILIYRIFGVVAPVVPVAFLHDGLIVLGLLSLVVAAGFVAFQNDLKRLWAYSSIEHIGLISLGVGFGGIALVGAMLHIWTHAISKTLLFQDAGTVRLLYHTSVADQGARALLLRSPWTGGLLALGAAAIMGLPPLAPFWSEWLILAGGFQVPGYRIFTMVATGLLIVIFIGIAKRLPAWLFTPGSPSTALRAERIREPWALVWPNLLLAILVLGGGIGAPLAAPLLWHHLVGELSAGF